MAFGLHGFRVVGPRVLGVLGGLGFYGSRVFEF